MEKPYKPQTFLNFLDTINFLEKLILSNAYEEKSEEAIEISQTVNSIVYFLGCLTTINSEDLFTT